MELNLELGQRVKELREALNLSRKDLAELLDISDYFLVEIELGRRGVSNVTLCKLADALCTTTDYLLRGVSVGSSRPRFVGSNEPLFVGKPEANR